MMKSRPYQLIVFGLIYILLPRTGFSQSANPDVWATNGKITGIEPTPGKTFLQGEFTWWGIPYVSGMAVFDDELVHDDSYPPLDYIVTHAISDDAGGWYTVTYSVITHIKADKTSEILPLELGSSSIYAMDKLGDILYIGGSFLSINGEPRNRLAAIDLQTNTVTSWNPNSNGTIYDIEVGGGVVYVGGSFSTVGGQTRSKIAAIDATSGMATSWNANVITGFGYVYTIEVGTNEVYFGGNFSNVASGSPSRRNFAAVNTTTGALITTVNPRPDDHVTTLLLDGNTLYIGGEYTVINGVTKEILAALDVTTGNLTAFHTTLTGYNWAGIIEDLAVDGQKLFIAGDFLTINGVEQPKLAVVDKTTGTLETMEPERKISGNIWALCAGGGVVFAGGSLEGISGVSRKNGLAAMDDATGEVTDWHPAHITEHVQLIHHQDNRVYYATIDAVPAYIGSVNTTDGAAIPGWDITIDGEISNWAFTETTVYIAGPFTTVNGTPIEGFAAIDLVTGNVLSWTTSYEPSYGDGERINSMIVSDNVLYVGGEFGFIGLDGIERNNLAAWDATTGALLPWAPQVELGEYQDVGIGAVHDGQVYLIHNVFLRVDAITGEPDDWTEMLDTRVLSMAIAGNSVFLSGEFSPGILNLDINTGSENAWQPELSDIYWYEGSVNVVAISDTKLYAGGNFHYSVGSESRYSYAEYFIPPPIVVINNDEVLSCSGTAATLRVVAEGTFMTGVTYQWQKLNEGTSLFEDITISAAYTGITSNRLTIQTSDASAAGQYRCHVTFDSGDLFSNNATLTVNPVPTAPVATGNSICNGEAAVLNASGATDGQYRWSETATGDPFENMNASQFTTPSMDVTTSYYSYIEVDGCESPRTEVIATVIEPAPPTVEGVTSCVPSSVTLLASGASAGNYRWYDVAEDGNALTEMDNEFTTPLLDISTPYYVSIIADGCESTRTEVIATIVNTVAPAVTSVSACSSSVVTLTASGGTDGNYRWYEVAEGGDALTETGNQFTTPVLGNTTSYYVSHVANSCESERTEVIASIVNSPSPSVTGASGCSPSSLILLASGGLPGDYRWYDQEEGGTSLEETGEQFTTPILLETTLYYVALVTDGCESERSEVIATIEATPSAPSVTPASGCAPSSMTLTATGGNEGDYRWYTEQTGGEPIQDATAGIFVTVSLTATRTFYVSLINGFCESPRVEAIATVTGPCTAAPPTIQTEELKTVAGGIITLNLLPLISIGDHALDISSISIAIPPLSGAEASIVDGVLTINYEDIPFTGTEAITIRACDLMGNCAEQQFDIKVAGEIITYNALSPGGANPSFIIENISLLPDTRSNKVIIYDRWQNEVWRGTDYDNSAVVFTGSNHNGTDLPTGTYFYKIEFTSGRKVQTGFISLKR